MRAIFTGIEYAGKTTLIDLLGGYYEARGLPAHYRVVDLDTTGRTPAESLDELLLESEPLVTFGELALRSLPVTGGKQRVVYRNGVRTLLPATD